MPTKMFSTTFGTTLFDSGEVLPGTAAAASTVSFFESATARYGIQKHDDEFYLDAAGNPLLGTAFVTFDFHDFRDLLTDGECLANVMVNIQRLAETPKILTCYNAPPLKNIHETIVVTNAAINFNDGSFTALSYPALGKFGFEPMAGVNQGLGDDQTQVIYAERRIYGQDRGQEYRSPNEMGNMTAGNPGTAGVPTRWTNNWLLLDRTVCGEADLVIGPELYVYRFIEVDCAIRDNQQVTTAAPPEPALEYVHNAMRVYLYFPALTVNIIGDKRSLTATEKAIEYTNVFLSNQNPPQP
tara:strand:- start:1484 stop:2377 length:894 start_codon:yes stop_codon:yes gene_type:complete